MDKKYNWQFVTSGDLKYWYIGSRGPVEEIASFIKREPHASPSELSGILRGQSGNFAAVIQQRGRIISFTDKIRSYPLFYVCDEDQFIISNSARQLKNECELTEIDELSLLEFRMAGYVTGRETLYRDLYQLQAGELLIWDEGQLNLEKKRYYLFFSEEMSQETEDDLIDELDEITDKIFCRVMEEANGSPIWVPLSGGLDSRLVLCKLKQLGYDNLMCFSYGPKGNYEAKAAQFVAEKLGVYWRFIPTLREEARNYFWMEKRKRFWEFADGLHIVPNIHWVDSIEFLLKEKLVSQDAIFINGQSGDFVAGDHIPKMIDKEIDVKLLCQEIMKKHYSLIETYLSDGECTKRITEKIILTIQSCLDFSIHNYQDFAKIYELWEWQERQCKRVINGQRTYDYYGFSWSLPLWADEYLKYWASIPLKYKLGRYLFRRYVEKNDFFGLFKDFKPLMSRWPGKLIFIQYLGNALKLLFGETFSKRYYRYLDYFSYYSNFYAPFSYKEYVNSCQNYRGALSFFRQVWENEYLSEVRIL